jgi:hypothetical protein
MLSGGTDTLSGAIYTGTGRIGMGVGANFTRLFLVSTFPPVIRT